MTEVLRCAVCGQLLELEARDVDEARQLAVCGHQWTWEIETDYWGDKQIVDRCHACSVTKAAWDTLVEASK